MALEMEDSSQAELCFQLRDTKPTGGDFQLMVWSPKMDLLAAALADHSVGNCALNICVYIIQNTNGAAFTACTRSTLRYGVLVLLHTGYTEPVVMATSMDYSSS